MAHTLRQQDNPPLLRMYEIIQHHSIPDIDKDIVNKRFPDSKNLAYPPGRRIEKIEREECKTWKKYSAFFKRVSPYQKSKHSPAQSQESQEYEHFSHEFVRNLHTLVMRF
ncbi:hypothetical protein MSWHS_0450 [Methanosarcina sp. WWM596]|nr:hypothetical protein MSWHS_0450 [Methanosarcina sp. WWM596]AKB20710.1 hypothetical protein MSWH1_0439 [Methanosarcina sp. WH1]